MRKEKVTRYVKRMTAGILAGIMALGLMACAAGEGQTQAASESVTEESAADGGDTQDVDTASDDNYKTVRIAVPGVAADGSAGLSESLFVAGQNGYLEEQLNQIGYTAEYTGFETGGVGVNEALAAGEADVAVYGDFPALTYIANNQDAQIIAIASTRMQAGILVAEGIDSVADLKGKKIGTILGTVPYKFLIDILAENNLTTDDVEIVNASSDLASLFMSGEIDAIAHSTQYLYYVQSAQAGNIIAVSGDSTKLSSNFIAIAKTALLDESPEIVDAIRTAFSEAQEYAEKNPEAVYQALADNAGGTISYEQFANDTGFDKTFSFWKPDITDEVKADLQETADFMYENQYIPAKIEIGDIVYQK